MPKKSKSNKTSKKQPTREPLKIESDHPADSVLSPIGRDGNLGREIVSVAGRPHSVEDQPAIRTYRPDGSLYSEQWFYHGQRSRPDEKPACITYFKNGKIKGEFWYHNGVAGRIDGFEDGDPSVVRYRKDGSVKEREWYLVGKPILISYYHKDGQVSYEAGFDEYDGMEYEASFDEAGIPVQRKEYENGILQKDTHFFSSGNIVSVWTLTSEDQPSKVLYRDDEKNSVSAKHWHRQGCVHRVELFDPDGSKTEECWYSALTSDESPVPERLFRSHDLPSYTLWFAEQNIRIEAWISYGALHRLNNPALKIFDTRDNSLMGEAFFENNYLLSNKPYPNHETVITIELLGDLLQQNFLSDPLGYYIGEYFNRQMNL